MSQEKLNLKIALDRLSVHREFAFVLNDIREQRESAIAKLVGSPTETVQQIAGAVVAYDEILKAYGADKIIKNYADSL